MHASATSTPVFIAIPRICSGFTYRPPPVRRVHIPVELCIAAVRERWVHLGGLATRHGAGRFRIVREIGRGGMGVVYEVEQLSLGLSCPSATTRRMDFVSCAPHSSSLPLRTPVRNHLLALGLSCCALIFLLQTLSEPRATLLSCRAFSRGFQVAAYLTYVAHLMSRAGVIASASAPLSFLSDPAAHVDLVDARL
jgi:hypothetical protein